MASEGDEDFKTGDKAWIKLPGYPPWPGRIEEPKNIRERKKVRPGFYLVFFYGTHETAIAARHELYKWNEENNKEWFVERDTIYFTDSLWEVENDPNVKRDAPLPAITKPPDLTEVNKYNPIVPPTFSDGEQPPEDGAASSGDSDSSPANASDSSSSSSSSSSDSDFEKRKKAKKKRVAKKKEVQQSKVKAAAKKPRKRKASASSDSSTVDDVDVSSSSSDEESVMKFAKLTAPAKPTTKLPRASATIIPKQLSPGKPKSPSASPRKPQPKMRKDGGSSDEEAALKKFAAEKSRDEIPVAPLSDHVQNEQVPNEDSKHVKEQSDSIAEPVNTTEGNSNLAAFLSESDNETSSAKTAPPISPQKATKEDRPSAIEVQIEEDSAVKSTPLAESYATKEETETMDTKDQHPVSEKTLSQTSDGTHRDKSPSPNTKLKKKLKSHKDRMDKEKQKSPEVRPKPRNALLDDSDSSNEGESVRKKPVKGELGKEAKRVSAIVKDAHKLSSEKILDKLHFELMKSLSQKSLNHERALTCLTEMKEYLTSDCLKKVPDVLISIKKVRKYKNDSNVQKKADEIFVLMRSLASCADSEVLTKLAEEKRKRQSEAASKVHQEANVSQGAEKVAHSGAEKDNHLNSSRTESSIPADQIEPKSEDSKLEDASVEPTNGETETGNVDDEGKANAVEVESEGLKNAKGATPAAVHYFFLRGAAGESGKEAPTEEMERESSSVSGSLDSNGLAYKSNGNKPATPTRDEDVEQESEKDEAKLDEKKASNNNSAEDSVERKRLLVKANNGNASIDIDSELGI